jgi:hypothetical protein
MKMKLRKMLQREEKKLLDFARSYLSEAFPNPSREGCPPEAALRLLAFQPKEADLSLTEHLSCCSPCFRQYQGFLAELKGERQAKKRGVWEGIFARTISSPAALVRTLVIAAAVAFAGYVLVVRLERPKTLPPAPPSVKPPVGIEYSEFVLDFSGLSPTRGAKQRAAGSRRRVDIPSSPLDLTLTLPVGSEERSYTVTLTSKGHIFWSKSTQAHLRHGQMLLRVQADFRQVPVGNYDLEVQSSAGIRLIQPVSIQPALPKAGEQKP